MINQAAFIRELVHVAAVAVAAIEDHTNTEFESVVGLVYEERARQDDKWGPQHHDPRAWMTILGEEFGEACKAALHLTHAAVFTADQAEHAAVLAARGDQP